MVNIREVKLRIAYRISKELTKLSGRNAKKNYQNQLFQWTEVRIISRGK